MYRLIRALLFCLPAEASHNLGLRALHLLHCLGLSGLLRRRFADRPVEVAGIRFPNPVGLAAGLDKNADYIDALGALGFGFIEVGTVTPRPQPGNPKPRLFRLRSEQAIINRMGFNNKGLEHMLKRLQRRRWRGVLGVNIGKNASTPLEHALDDYLQCFNAVYSHADYIVVNLSSPNTPGLRELQFGAQLDALLRSLKEAQAEQENRHRRHVPFFVKIAPDLADAEIEMIAASLRAQEVEGVIATNTTVERDMLGAVPHAGEQGGLSGAPLKQSADTVLEKLAAALQGRVPIIAVGGITRGEDAADKIRRGASLVQLYSGFIYRGPALIAEAAEAVAGAADEQAS